jgi:probable DNA repair protein
MDATIVAAIEAGRSVIVPDAHCAAALRFRWARRQQARGVGVWETPEILTWDAWLERQWQRAAARGAQTRGQTLLNRSQERVLWQRVLPQLEGEFGSDQDLRQQAGALQTAAARACAAQIVLPRHALTDEERLLVAALRAVREQCKGQQWLSLRIAAVEDLTFLAGSSAPLIAGVPALTSLQESLAQAYWPDQPLLAPIPTSDALPLPQVHAAVDRAQEIAACAQWCRQMLSESPARRLLVISAGVDLDLHSLGAWLWREFSADCEEGQLAECMTGHIAVEGGTPLARHALIGDAFAALTLLVSDDVDSELLQQVLRSPYLPFGGAADGAMLGLRLAEQGLARWPRTALLQVLANSGVAESSATQLATWLRSADPVMAPDVARSATHWAEWFSTQLRALRFAIDALHSSDVQRLRRWELLLDEFAALDALQSPLTPRSALEQLRELARQAMHDAATGDAAITVSGRLDDPVADYDGIWVMGLTESSWPAAPRPDAFVALAAQRASGWSDSGVTQRLAHARWSLQCWRARTARLQLSYSRQEGDVLQRPSALLAPWPVAEVVDQRAMRRTRCQLGPALLDAQLPPMASTRRDAHLPGGVQRLRSQQLCAFRGQTEYRLLARAPESQTEGLGPRQRGILLHAVLERIWRELQGQAALLALDDAGRRALIARHWRDASLALRDTALLGITPRVLQRERERTLRLLLPLLNLEATRAGFHIAQLEKTVALATPAGSLRMRLDRVDIGPRKAPFIIDYKTGDIAGIALHEGDVRPVQLAAYLVALQREGSAIDGAAFLSLRPGAPEFIGATVEPADLPGKLRRIEDWSRTLQSLEQGIAQLIAAHLAGDAQVAPEPRACDYCHLPALCRKQLVGADETETDDE